MLHELDEALKQLLMKAKDEIPGLLEIAEVSFATPDDTFAPDEPLINLFLLDIMENTELRNLQPVREQIGGVVISRAPPLRVDCTYLVTAWSNANGEEQSRLEHRLLGEALLWFSRTDEIPPTMLEGSLKQSAYPPGLSITQAQGDRQAGQFWSALRIAPRAAFFLTVTLAMDVQRVLGDVRPLGDIILRTGLRAADGHAATPPEDAAVTHIIGGRVMFTAAGSGEEAEPQPVAGARVTVQPGGHQIITDANGMYILGPLPEDTYHLTVSAAGFDDGVRDVQLPVSDPDATFDVILRQSQP